MQANDDDYTLAEETNPLLIVGEFWPSSARAESKVEQAMRCKNTL
jgi:hypothetical protein